MGRMNIAVVVGVTRNGECEVLHAGMVSAASDVRKQARRLHQEYVEIRTYSIPSMVEKTRSDLPALLEGVVPTDLENQKGNKAGKKDGVVGSLLSKLTGK